MIYSGSKGHIESKNMCIISVFRSELYNSKEKYEFWSKFNNQAPRVLKLR